MCRYTCVALLLLGCYIPIASLTPFHVFLVSKDQQMRYAPFHVVLLQLLRMIGSSLKIFFTNYPTSYLLFMAISTATLSWTFLANKPCNIW